MSRSGTPARTSFVITCHNLGAYLEEALASLFAQTDQDFDVIVVNDGSTDGATCRLLADLARPRTTVVHTERRGLPGARNLGARHAAGTFLCMVDADDVLEPEYLERSAAVLTASGDLGFASHWLRAFGDEQWEWTPTDCGFPALLHANTLNGAALMRRAMFEQLGGFDESMVDGCEDWEFWIRAVEHGYRGVIIPEFLFRYRRRADSMSRTMHAVPGMPALYREIVMRHEWLFAAHLQPLLARRDGEIAAASANLWRLGEAWAGDVEGRLQWLSDNCVALEGGPDPRGSSTTALQDLEAARAEARRLHADFSREHELNLALRSSWSWRLTGPLRQIARLLRP